MPSSSAAEDSRAWCDEEAIGGEAKGVLMQHSHRIAIALQEGLRSVGEHLEMKSV